MLKQAKKAPDIDNYLCFLLSDVSAANTIVNTEPIDLHAARSAAAIMLKNDIKTHYKSIPQPSQDYIRSRILLGLRDPHAQMRNFAGNVVTEIVRQAGVLGWPEVLPELVSTIGNSGTSVSEEAQEGAMGALLKICEDNQKALAKSYQGQCPIDFLAGNLLNFMSSPLPKVRINAIAAFNIFVKEKLSPIGKHLDAFMVKLFELANDSNEDTRKQICRAIVHVAEMSPEKIAPHMEGLVDYMVAQQRTPNDLELALDAAEFWLCVGEDKNLRESLAPYLEKIIPVLLESMVYSEEDVLRLEAEDEEDAETEDREQDIKPQFASSKVARAKTSSINYVPVSGDNDSSSLLDDDRSEGEIEDDEDDDDEDDDPEESWNLRKCSAAALDVLASVFHETVFTTTLPYLKLNLNHAAWPNREAAVLAIGAIANGCLSVVQPHLPDLIPFLVSLLQDPFPVVRQITCWSLGRYSGWASHLDSAGKDQYFLPMMDGILKRMLDNNKRVQEAAASAFANLEEQANKELENPKYCEVIARQFAECFSKYKDRNMFILYDCVQTLAEHVGPTLQSPELVRSLMPALLKRWEKVSDQSREMFPLLECLSYVATALGNTFQPYAGPIFDRCIRIITTNLQDAMQAVNRPELDEPDKDFLVTSLDLLSAIIQALDEQESARLVTTSQPSMFDLLIYCLEDSNNDVKQSAYALLGDCAIYIFASMQSSLDRILNILVGQLDLEQATSDDDNDFAVTNNACWACGEITLKAQAAMAPYAETFLQRFYAILCNDKVVQLHDNAATSLGRLGLGCPEILAPHLVTLAPPFLKVMRGIEWSEEKATAVGGLAQAVIANPQGLELCLLEFVGEIARAPLAGDAAARTVSYELFQRVSSRSCIAMLVGAAKMCLAPPDTYCVQAANSKLRAILAITAAGGAADLKEYIHDIGSQCRRVIIFNNISLVLTS